MDQPIYIDFETEAIGPRPMEYPPKPVGVAVYDPTTGEAAYYTEHKMKERLDEIWATGRPLSGHNMSFDLDVAETHLGLPWPTNYHDTLTMAFLTDCHVPYLSLKYLVEKWCNDPATTRDELHEWIMANVPEATAKTAGAYICRAPVELVAPYAIDDVKKTKLLYNYCLPHIEQQQAAYRREIALQKVLIDNERAGVRVDRVAMQKALTDMTIAIDRCDAWIRQRLNTPDLEVGSGPQLAKALLASDAYDHQREWPRTKKGKTATDKQTVADMVTDPALVDTLRYRSYATTIAGTFAGAWLEASRHDGRIYTQWNAVRGEHGGTRTGRLSGRPTLQTAPARYPKLEHLPLELPPLPKVREWILPDEGEVLVAADFSGQELRVFAHFENGQLAEQYRKDPDADLHQFAADMMSEMVGFEVSRRDAKTLAFTIIYGGGPARVAEACGCSLAQARQLIDAYKTAVVTKLAGIQAIMDNRYRLKKPFKTLGGRLVKGEPATIIDGALRMFNYKMINLLVQGSSADQAKQAMVDFKGPGRLLLSVHDELVLTVRPELAEEASRNLVDVMCNALPLSVPMRSDVKIGNNYAECK